MTTVMKFGGTSVADAAAFENVARIIAAERDASPVVVVSAMSRVTDSLLAATTTASERSADKAIASLENVFNRHNAVAREFLPTSKANAFASQVNTASDHIFELLQQLSPNAARRKAIQDEVVSFGETLSSSLLAEILSERGLPARQVDARRCIITNDEFTCAAPLMDETFSHTENELRPVVESGVVPVLGGFIGSTTHGATTTLGRGGSDYTAALIGAALRTRQIQIWTDVTGVLTADPRVVPEAHTVNYLSYGEAAELAYFGAKVLHPKTIHPAIVNSIPVRIANSRLPEHRGTVVGPQTENSPKSVKAIAHKTGVTVVKVTSGRMLGAFGFLRALFEVFDKHRTVVDVVTTSEVSVSLSLDDVSMLDAIVADLELLGTVRVERARAIICVVGEGFKGMPAMAASVFRAIGDIHVTMISQGASSINFTFVIEEQCVHDAVRRLHETFFGQDYRINKTNV
jgi:aspartate kinase